ncbi:MAG: DUF1566 domain-containing protein [Nitrospiraceae bacterium]|nr:MAG: DUF1566 domain-containing protein [Nitrospiraceae bacterium]
MKNLLIFLFVLAAVSGFSTQSYAGLELRGTDSLGVRLIYDSDLDVTWYDHTNSYNTWQNQMDWVSALTVDFGGTIYDDWRLPSTVDGIFSLGYDGTTTAGYNITSSEMGHLFYTGLENKGYCDASANCPQPGWGLTNTGPFLNLRPYTYWSGTEYAADTVFAWSFSNNYGYQGSYNKDYNPYYAVAVRPGDVAVVPEPVSMMLFGIGAVLLVALRIVIRRRG